MKSSALSSTPLKCGGKDGTLHLLPPPLLLLLLSSTFCCSSPWRFGGGADIRGSGKSSSTVKLSGEKRADVVESQDAAFLGSFDGFSELQLLEL
nr:hypothetical protein Iba_scaffold21028CG0070 [Ipomoea batatas]